LNVVVRCGQRFPRLVEKPVRFEKVGEGGEARSLAAESFFEEVLARTWGEKRATREAKAAPERQEGHLRVRPQDHLPTAATVAVTVIITTTTAAIIISVAANSAATMSVDMRFRCVCSETKAAAAHAAHGAAAGCRAGHGANGSIDALRVRGRQGSLGRSLSLGAKDTRRRWERSQRGC
jgi:hypothetical protein